jgi:hypothetical protein
MLVFSRYGNKHKGNGAVLKKNKYCVIIIGSNEIQTGGIRHEVEIKRIAPIYGLTLQSEIIKPIKVFKM